MNNIICFLTVTPNEKFYAFVKQLPDIDNIYICIDNNDYNIPNYDGKIKIIKINNKESIENGFHSSLTGFGNPGFKNPWTGKAGSRDKALYYFYKNNINYDYIWFIEEDVFIPTVETIKNIDIKYPDNDLLVGNNKIIHEKHTDWLWSIVNEQIDGKISLPYSCSMICAIRCSKKLLESIFTHVLKYKALFLDEVLFNTIALHNNLSIQVIEELSTIHWCKNWEKNDININNLYHPIKSIDLQYEFRK